MAEQEHPQDQDVPDGSSPSPEADAQAAPGAVTASGADAAETDAQGVPWKNRMAEMERKHDKHVQELQQMFQQQLAALQPAPFQAPAQKQTYTDEELFALGNQGHFQAHVELQQRIAQRQLAAQQRSTLTEQHIGALRQLYPDFANPSSTLYQAANTLYRQYLAAGYPASAETQHTAMSTAAAAYARQQQQQQGVGQAAEASRQQGLEAHQSVGGVSTPPAGSNRRRPAGPTPEQQALAAKIGVKDPAGAIARFQKRAAEGRTTFGGGMSSAAERVLP